MFNPCAANGNKVPDPLLAQPGAPPDSEGVKQPTLPGTPYKPYSEKPAVPETPYKPYSVKAAIPEPPYEPYKGM